MMASLSGIALLIYVLGYFVRKAENRKPTAGINAIFGEKSLEEPEAFTHGIEQNRLCAIIAAAVDEVIKEPHKIVSIRCVDEGQVSGELFLQAWSAEGRRQHFESHKVR